MARITVRKMEEFEMAIATTQVRTDDDIRDSVLQELKWEPKILSPDVAVAVKDGVVTLTGFVSSYWERDAAEKAAKRVYGVRGVANSIHIKLTMERSGDRKGCRSRDREPRRHPDRPDQGDGQVRLGDARRQR
jgi:hypothetical protein